MSQSASTNATATEPRPGSADTNGRLILSSQVSVTDAGDNESARITNKAVCGLWFESNGYAPIEIRARFRPTWIGYSGSTTDEIGFSQLYLRWRVIPWCEVDLRAVLTLRPEHFGARQVVDPSGDMAWWGPPPDLPGPTLEATWTYLGPIVRGDCYWLRVGIQTEHRVTANDISMVSDLEVDFTLDSVRIQAS